VCAEVEADGGDLSGGSCCCGHAYLKGELSWPRSTKGLTLFLFARLIVRYRYSSCKGLVAINPSRYKPRLQRQSFLLHLLFSKLPNFTERPKENRPSSQDNTGYDCGFDMVLPPSRGGTDLDLWEEFLEAVTSEYKHDDVIRYQSNDTIEFLVGEHPSLPQEGWKFLRFSSKATNGAEPYIRAVSRMARERFGDRVRFWHELAESDGHYTWAEVSASLATYDEVCGESRVGDVC
jgi:hypothetical protein